jgi:GNAT superfamily N-acetyltransferase
MFKVTRLGPSDLELVLKLQAQIPEALLSTGIFQVSTPDFISYCLRDGGRCYAVHHNYTAVAYRIVYFPRDREFNLAQDSPLPPAEHSLAAHWDTVAVLPRWRGHRLAALMNAQALADMANTQYRHLFATSSPANPHGVRTLIQAGFRPIRLVRKFGGKSRFLCYRPNPDGWLPVPSSQVGRQIPLDATDTLADALDSGWVGTGITVTPPASRLLLTCQPVPITSTSRLSAHAP